MNRRTFLSTTAASASFLGVQANEPKSFKGIIKKAVKFGSKPNETQMQKLKDLGFDGIEGSAPGLQVEPMKKACAKIELPMHGVVYNKHWKVRLSDPDPKVREDSRKGLAQAMKESKGGRGNFRSSCPRSSKGRSRKSQACLGSVH